VLIGHHFAKSFFVVIDETRTTRGSVGPTTTLCGGLAKNHEQQSANTEKIKVSVAS
jgi:hypothetical protein